ncbi:MAG TPA: penicillin acylase family protein [Candidatus Sulfomarinibacteraceae bacterium]|nr:penicillin acylase family protein [Candidatus Sulfomarinibacteraceae bacterium]
MRRWLKVLFAVLAALLVLALAAALWVRHALTASLPILDGEVAIPGVTAPVTIERDANGVPTIRGSDRLDVARGLGFVHAQERFFQMDLLRRQGAGELSELFGPVAVEADRASRLHRFRHRAGLAVALAPDAHRQVIDAYVSGVNGGLAALGGVPFEYLLLRLEPEPWTAEDTILALYAMYFTLNDSTGDHESARAVAADVLDPELLAFLAPAGTSWDAPLDGVMIVPPPLPGPAHLATDFAAPPEATDPEPALAAVGSNNWAVAGSRTADGRAIVANDMHLPLGVPTTWFRARMVWPADPGGRGWHDLTGVTLAGTPAMVAGSTGRVAWGFTNSYGDWSDLVVLEAGGDGYLTPEGPRPFDLAEETIRVRGAEPVVLEVRSTIWGPVIGRDHLGRERALRWIAHDPEAATLGLVDLEHAADLEEALDIAAAVGIPPQNFVCADAAGRIGWTLIGRIPKRFGFSGAVPTSWADGSCGWDGYLDPQAAPRIVDPPDGVLWSANNRTTSGETFAVLGDGGTDLGARARQIRDGLLALSEADESDMLAVQLDDRAVLLEGWRTLALEVLDDEAVEGHPSRALFRDLVRDTWTGRASVDSQAFRLVRAFRYELFERVVGRLMAPCEAVDERFDIFEFAQWEDALWRMATERPAHLLGPDEASWEAVLVASLDATVEHLTTEVGDDPSLWTWGRRNTLRMRHPMSLAVPQLAGWLDMPAVELPGASLMPRVQSPTFGASERFAVSPGREADGYFHMPGGQSGHPLSPHYRAGHQDWVEGRPAPFLPGATATVLTLVPAP